MTLGPVRVMGAGVVLILCAREVNMILKINVMTIISVW